MDLSSTSSINGVQAALIPLPARAGSGAWAFWLQRNFEISTRKNLAECGGTLPRNKKEQNDGTGGR
jgi:hypothetical protein